MKAWIAVGMALFVCSIALMMHSQSPINTPDAPVFAAEEPAVIIPPDKRPMLEWANPASNIGPKQVKFYVLGIWRAGDSDGPAMRMERIEGTGEELVPGADCTHNLRTLLSTLDPGQYVLRLNAVGQRTSAWAPADGIHVEIQADITPDAPLNVRITVTLNAGDCNGDGATDVGDVAYLCQHLFCDGPAPKPCGWRV